MSYLIFALGLFLSFAGAYAIFSGYTIVDIERGWTAVIAGSVLLSGGMIVMSLAFVVRGLARLSLSITKRNIRDDGWDNPVLPLSAGSPPLPEPEVQPVHFEAPASRNSPPQHEQKKAQNNPALGTNSFAEAQQEAPMHQDLQGTAVSLPPRRVPVAAPARAEFAHESMQEASQGSAMARSVFSTVPMVKETNFMPPRWGAERAPAPPPNSTEISSNASIAMGAAALRPSLEMPREDLETRKAEDFEKTSAQQVQSVELKPSHSPQHEDLPSEMLHLPEPADKLVTGRYETDEVVYTMFEDGSIEAKSATEIVNYPSMDALKASFAANEAGD